MLVNTYMLVNMWYWAVFVMPFRTLSYAFKLHFVCSCKMINCKILTKCPISGNSKFRVGSFKHWIKAVHSVETLAYSIKAISLNMWSIYLLQ